MKRDYPEPNKSDYEVVASSCEHVDVPDKPCQILLARATDGAIWLFVDEGATLDGAGFESQSATRVGLEPFEVQNLITRLQHLATKSR